MIPLFLDSGPRVSAVASLPLGALNLDDREAKLMGKGRNERRIPFGQKTTRALMRYASAFRPQPAGPKDDSVFLSVDGYPLMRNAIELIIRRLRHASGVGKLHAHLLVCVKRKQAHLLIENGPTRGM
jgi:site-specific recombinase XerD